MTGPGSTHNLTTPRADAVDTDGPWTIAFWFFPDAGGLGSEQVILSTGETGSPGDGEVELRIGINDDNTPFAEVGTDNVTFDTSRASVDEPVVADTWYFMVARWDQNSQTILVDVVPEGTAWSDRALSELSHGQDITDNGGNLQIGMMPDATGNYYGLLDALSFHSANVTTDDLEWLYNDGSGRVYGSVVC